MAEEKQDGQKTLVAFVVGLLIGGMLVWAFSGPTAGAPKAQDDKSESKETMSTTGVTKLESKSDEASNESESAPEAKVPELSVGTGDIKVPDQAASKLIKIDSATYPVSEGWIGVRSYTGEQLGSILGVVRFSEEQGLVPTEIVLVVPTTAGKKYAVVVFTEDGDRDFNLAGDVQIDQIFDTFEAK